MGDTEIEIVVGDTIARGVLFANPVGRQIAARLPLHLRFSDLNRVEKISELDWRPETSGMPRGSTAAAGDIGYYEPAGDLVLYYSDVGYWAGIMIVGRLVDAPESVPLLGDSFDAELRSSPT